MLMVDIVDQTVVERLVAAVGPDNVETRASERRAFAADGLRAGRAALVPVAPPLPPLAIVRPDGAAEVAAVLRVAAESGLAVVPYGGGTGLMGGARVVRPGIVLDLARMNRVLAVSREDRTARAQAGIVFADLNAALAPHGLVCGHDPWTVPIATLGGAISTHGLGYLGGRYGSIGDQVLGLEVVLADGAVVRTRAAERSATGPQLRRLWVGAEGTLGVITEATLRVFPSPEARVLRAYHFPTFAEGFEAICAIAAIGLRPAMIDYGGPPDGQDPARLQLAFEGFREEVEAGARRAESICRDYRMTDAGEAEARRFFENRHVDAARLRGWRSGESQDPAPGTPGSSVFDYLHLYLPQSQVLEFLRGATARFAEAGADVVEWGLWNQPELVSLAVRADTETPAACERLRAAHDAAVSLAQELGGSMEYVHGVGIRLAHLIEQELGEGLSVLRRIKTALDPGYVLNPGKLAL
jgi:alkyldihydroxyacetonephosphate synthase